MLTREELQGQWDELKGQIRKKWGQLTDDDLQKAKGNAEQLVGVIAQKTGAAKREIETFLDQAASRGESILNQAAATATDYAKSATETADRFARHSSAVLQDQYSNVSDAVRYEYDQTQQLVKARPMQSIGLALGVGVVAGTLIGLMLRSSRA